MCRNDQELPIRQGRSGGGFPTTFQQFIGHARRWLSTDANVKRLALACTLWEPASTSDEALKILLPNIRSLIKESDDRIIDFLVQLNRPLESQVNPLITINRFARWSTRIVEIVLPTRNIMSQPPTIRSPRAQADLDISTAGEADIAGGQIPAHLDELAALLRDIAEKGDTP
jgi:hypothetical protein